MMSDDDRDIDIESDAENDSDSRTHARNSVGGSGYYSQAEKRAHHNALERKRRDHIKDSFTSLREAVPALQNEKVLQSVESRHMQGVFFSSNAVAASIGICK
nr:unnamed protein product [Spodoptera littoralis]